jgi:phytoene dehydrogenase-like protein
MRVVVIGGGVGGLTAAARLAALGHDVRLLEARSQVGGLASGFTAGGLWFDGGPYILLDRPGLEWAFERIGIDSAVLDLRSVPHLYDVDTANTPPLSIFLDLQRTTQGFDERWPGAGRKYQSFVSDMEKLRQRLAPLLVVPNPNLRELVRRGAVTVAPFLLRSLGGVLRRHALPREIVDAIGIWSHIAGQSLAEAASVMAFVPALVHRVGAFVPRAGMRAIPDVLQQRAAAAGATLQCGVRATRVRTQNGRVSGVETEDGEVIACDAVISNAHGVGTYQQLVEGVPASLRRRLDRLPLQSPGLCAYLGCRGAAPDAYLRFRLDDTGVTLAVAPARVTASAPDGARFPIRLIKPLPHRLAERTSEEAQAAELQTMLGHRWWREGLSDVELVAARTARQWGREMSLYRDSMNPSMNRALLLRGRLPHRSPWVRGLYLAGASTHPGQWVSFCAISGVLAADAAHADRARR